MATKLLLTDASSPLGTAIAQALEIYPYRIIAPAPGEVDWCNADAVAAYLQNKPPKLLINTLGWSEAPDLAQQQLLMGAAHNLALACQAYDIVPIHLSSFRVFGSDYKSAYEERDQPAPDTDGGRAFLAAERSFEILKRHINLRLSWLLSDAENGLVDGYVRRMCAHETVTAANRYRGSPTHIGDVARVVTAIIPQIFYGAENWGTFHYAASDPVTELELVEEIAAVLKSRQLLPADWRPVATVGREELRSASLAVRRCIDNFGIQVRGWRPGLKILIERMLDGPRA